jgi:hypothetical protein
MFNTIDQDDWTTVDTLKKDKFDAKIAIKESKKQFLVNNYVDIIMEIAANARHLWSIHNPIQSDDESDVHSYIRETAVKRSVRRTCCSYGGCKCTTFKIVKCTDLFCYNKFYYCDHKQCTENFDEYYNHYIENVQEQEEFVNSLITPVGEEPIIVATSAFKLDSPKLPRRESVSNIETCKPVGNRNRFSQLAIYTSESSEEEECPSQELKHSMAKRVKRTLKRNSTSPSFVSASTTLFSTGDLHEPYVILTPVNSCTEDEQVKKNTKKNTKKKTTKKKKKKKK